MELITDPFQAAQWSADQRLRGSRVAFVPTMGALHEGHLALVTAAAERAEVVAVSIFVNPLQFNDPKDLEKYPRQPERDAEMLRSVGCDMLFLPEAEDLFKDFKPTTYDLALLNTVLEGSSRPGHFQGVVNVVERLFQYVRPDVALFGEKDRQQLAVLRHAAHTNHWPVQVVGMPTIRNKHGLALSSRNQRLSEKERMTATVLYRALQAAAKIAFHGTVGEARGAALLELGKEPGVALDYFSIAHPDNLQPLGDWEGLNEAVALVAAQVGPVRLIDNMTLRR